MNLTGNTVLITGGSSGIGLELSKQLLERDNKVIICGRSVKKLEAAKKQLPKVITYQCDLADANQITELTNKIKIKYPDLNVLVNNAAIVHKAGFLEADDILQMAEKESQTNFLAPIRLIHHLYDVLKKNQNPHIINVSTGLIYVPRAMYPFYNSTKAALHAFTQTIRWQTQNQKVKICEVMFPAVDTPWHKGKPPKIAISPERAVSEMLRGLQKGKPEIRVCRANLLYRVSRIAPKFAMKKVNSLG
jgi:uncharacterized oxidoreductase